MFINYNLFSRPFYSNFMETGCQKNKNRTKTCIKPLANTTKNNEDIKNLLKMHF